MARCTAGAIMKKAFWPITTFEVFFSRLCRIKIYRTEYIYATGYYAPTKIYGSYTGKVVDFDISTNMFVMMTGNLVQIPQ